MTNVKAEVVVRETPRPFPEAWAVHARYVDGFDIYGFSSLDKAEQFVKQNNYRILRLPSEQEAALQPLVDAVNKAAVEWCESMRRGNNAGILDAREAYLAADSALAAARKEQG